FWGLVRHWRATGDLPAGLILRALLPGHLELFEAALAELSDLPLPRVSALLQDRGGASLQALLKRSGLPESTFAAFRVALDVCHEIGFADSMGTAARLRRRLVQGGLTRAQPEEHATQQLCLLRMPLRMETRRERA